MKSRRPISRTRPTRENRVAVYDLVHITRYEYAVPVDLEQCVLRHQPVDKPWQRVVASVLNVTPAPRRQVYGHDFFGNRTAHLTFSGLHEELLIEARSRVRVEPRPAPEMTPPFENIRSIAAMSIDLTGASPVHFLFGSTHVPLLSAAEAFAGLSAHPGRAVLEVASAISDRIHDEFEYDPKATQVSTPIARTFEKRRGVCQDFAHVMIAALRTLGLPAAYVSGYLRTLPPPGKPRLVGADASHAWVNVWCGPVAGWVGIDPTNRRLAGVDHIICAIGRDYSDIAPVAGIFRTSGDQELKVSVDVQEVVGH